MRRQDLTPRLADGGEVPLASLLEHLRLWRAESAGRVDSLRDCRRQVEERAGQFESPRAVVEYLDFFVDFFTRAGGELDGIAAALPAGVRREHLDALRQIASNAAAEQRRCLLFRDKWINRILPFEAARPLLTRISNETRDQLADYLDLQHAASRLEAMAGPAVIAPVRGIGRRDLFNRLLGRDPAAGSPEAAE